ncbi:TerC family protein [Prosthecobacter sp.]|jgi:predicted tellurium resistance membrane protein TerC|uniref:TerC family protein n=1 Tax=Prosthecobacter sp. TaxID=1965333 RepID=UPI003784B240
MIANAAAAVTANLNVLDFSWVANPEAWIAVLTLCLLEIVLGIDNIVFISILVDKLPAADRPRGRFIGLGLAMLTRILLLMSITWVMSLTAPLFTVLEHSITGKDLVLIFGGLFLIYKSTHEIHEKLEGDPEGEVRQSVGKGAAFGAVMVQIALLDIVFSLDSVITAVGMVKHISIMVTAVLISVGFMMVFARAVGEFVTRHPTVKMLALSFLILIGTALIGEGLHFEIPKGYIYFAMGFSMMVEMLNLKAKKKQKRAA